MLQPKDESAFALPKKKSKLSPISVPKCIITLLSNRLECNLSFSQRQK